MNEKKQFSVQTWMGRVLEEFDTLSEAIDYKEEICGDDEGMSEDTYIIGIDEDGKEFAPDFGFTDKERY